MNKPHNIQRVSDQKMCVPWHNLLGAVSKLLVRPAQAQYSLRTAVLSRDPHGQPRVPEFFFIFIFLVGKGLR